VTAATTPVSSEPVRAQAGAQGTYAYFALACAFTWVCDLPVVLAALRHVEAPAYGLPLAGLGGEFRRNAGR
jgi:hypothetical protein